MNDDEILARALGRRAISATNDQVISLISARLDRIEAKVDKLMAFRSYMAGIAAACGLLGSALHSLYKGF